MDAPRQEQEETSRVGVDADPVAEPMDARVEIDAGVVLFGLVLMVLLCIPVSMALLRSGLVGRRGLGSRSKRSRRRGPVDAWAEAGRRVDQRDLDGDAS